MGPGRQRWLRACDRQACGKAGSDLDIVIYAERRMTADEAESLCDHAMNLPAAVDIRAETPMCGFSDGVR